MHSGSANEIEHLTSYVVYDLETSSFYPEGEIVEFGAIKVVDGRPVEKFSEMCALKGCMNPRATAVNHITDSMLRGKRSLRVVFRCFTRFVGILPLVGFNNHSFDDLFIKREIGRAGGRNILANGSYDVMLMHGRATLAKCCEEYGIENDGAHRAVNDARVTYLLYEAMCDEAARASAYTIDGDAAKATTELVRKPVDRRDVLRLLPGKRFPDEIFTKPLGKIAPGMTFVLSGEFLWYGGRSLIERAINMAGCVVRSSVSGATDAVVLGTIMSGEYGYGYGGKVRKAQEINSTKGKHVAIMRERDFLKLLIDSNVEVKQYLAVNKAMIERFWSDSGQNIMVPKSGFTDDQIQFAKAVGSGRNVWLTGQAGTGKSYVLSAVIQRLSHYKNVAVAAPTGIAALNVGGVTLHSLLHMEPCCEFDKAYLDRLSRMNYLVDYDILVIDEISMCSIALFDVIGQAIAFADAKRVLQGKSPIQLVVVGDFGQLPPVVTKDEAKAFAEYYGFDMPSWYCFLSDYWPMCNFLKVELTKSIRQSDSRFVAALNSIRVGDYVSLKWVELNAAKSANDKAVFICGTNADANGINERHLRSLPGPEVAFDAIVEGAVDLREEAIEERVVLRCGARVMSLKNGSGYANGSMGVVERLTRKFAVVLFDDGVRANIVPLRWPVKKVVSDNGVWRVCTVGYITQIPLRLAKAITCHKSQGKTFDAINIMPSFWDNGQMYTAISRAKSVDGVFVCDGFGGHAFVTSDVVVDFMSGMTREQIISKHAGLAENVRKRRSEKRKATKKKDGKSSPRGKRPVEMIDASGNVIMSFDSVAAAARHVGCDTSSIRRVLNHDTRRAAGYRWRDKV